MNLRPLKNYVLFKFLDRTSGAKGMFTDRTTQGGIILTTNENEQKQPRWGEVIAVGPDVYGIEPGEFILVEALMWTVASKVEDQKVWKTDDTKVLLVTEDVQETYNTRF